MIRLLIAAGVALGISLVGTQAFVNYYYFVVAMLACSALALGRGTAAA